MVRDIQQAPPFPRPALTMAKCAGSFAAVPAAAGGGSIDDCCVGGIVCLLLNHPLLPFLVPDYSFNAAQGCSESAGGRVDLGTISWTNAHDAWDATIVFLIMGCSLSFCCKSNFMLPTSPPPPCGCGVHCIVVEFSDHSVQFARVANSSAA